MSITPPVEEPEDEAYVAALRAAARGTVARELEAGAGEADVVEELTQLEETPEERAEDDLEAEPE